MGAPGERVLAAQGSVRVPREVTLDGPLRRRRSLPSGGSWKGCWAGERVAQSRVKGVV